MADYSRLAPFYHRCEQLIYGQTLQRCRTAFMADLPRSLLVIGEGDGRFSQALREARPEISLTMVEPDEAMRTEGMKRSPENDLVRWLPDFPKDPPRFDALILNFVADCHEPTALKELLLKAGPFLHPPKVIIIGDFFPEAVSPALARFGARVLVKVMYLFFRLSAAERVQRLPPTEQILRELGWTCQRTHSQWRGFIQAQWWERNDSPTR